MIETAALSNEARNNFLYAIAYPYPRKMYFHRKAAMPYTTNGKLATKHMPNHGTDATRFATALNRAYRSIIINKNTPQHASRKNTMLFIALLEKNARILLYKEVLMTDIIKKFRMLAGSKPFPPLNSPHIYARNTRMVSVRKI